MDAKPWSFLSVLEPKSCYEVPLYQRQYVWDHDNQWEPLWEDISRKLREGFMQEDAPPHFLGAIVVDQEQTRMEELKRHLVIDGQQRLITFQIFLSALRDFSKSNNHKDLADELDKFIFNKGMMTNPDHEKYKIWSSERDMDFFQNVIEIGSREGLENKYPLIIRKYQRKPDPRPKIVEAYFYFYDRISKFFIEPVEDSSGNTILLADKLTAAFHILGKALQVVVIELSREDDAQVIFETLNARGQPLLPSDLLRNFIFLRVREDKGLRTAEVYESYWKDFDEEFWRNEITLGRTTRPRSDLFMQHFLAAQTTRDISVKHLYVEYKNWAIKEHPFPTVREELEAIASYRKSFRRLIEPQSEDPISHLAHTLKLFDMTTAYPPLMVLLTGNLNDGDLVEVGNTLESYLMRRAILNLSSKNLNRIFLGLASHLKANGISVSNVNDYLSTRTGDSGQWPTDEQFLEGWMTTQIHDTMSRDSIIHLLLHLNSEMSTGKNEKVETTYLTVEHLMPYQWEEYWPLPDGSKGMTYSELYGAEEGNKRAEATKFRNSKVQTIGNLTIISGPLNSAIQNRSWNIKKAELQKHSLLAINRMLWGLDEWNEVTIENRSKELFGLAKRIWGPPVKKGSIPQT